MKKKGEAHYFISSVDVTCDYISKVPYFAIYSRFFSNLPLNSTKMSIFAPPTFQEGFSKNCSP